MRFSDGAAFDFKRVDPQRAGKIKVTLLDAQQQLKASSSELSGRNRPYSIRSSIQAIRTHFAA